MKQTRNSSLVTHHSLLFLILLAAAAIQFHTLGRDTRFYPDEALFSTFARRAALNGDWLLHGDLDKTPLAIYGSALSMHFVAASVQNGVLDFEPRLGEFAARLPGAVMSLILVAASYTLALRLYRRQSVAAWTAIFTAFSPFAAVYGATAFTDVPMIALGALGLLAVTRGSWLWGGIWLALAFATKQQAIYLLPLVLLIGWAMAAITPRRLITFAVPLIAGILLLLAWDAARAQSASLWSLALANNSISIIHSDDAMPRLGKWLSYARELLGTPTILLSIAAVVMLGWRVTRQAGERASRIDVMLLVFTLGYLLLHWLVAFNSYPRYLLPLLVPAALLAARALVWLWAWVRPRLSDQEGTLIAGALAVTLFFGAWNATETPAALNEDTTDYGGIIKLADYLNAQTLGAVVYDRWLGWELGYYMGQWTDKRRVYYPTPEALAAGALALDDPAPRYVVAPTRISIDVWLDALREAGFSAEQVYLRDGFVVYRIIPPWAERAGA